MNDLHRENPNINNIPGAIRTLSPTVFLRRLKAKPIETSERILVYDGSSLHEKLPIPIFYKSEKRDSYNIMNLASAENPYFPHTYFNWICYAPELPDGDNRTDHIPRMFDAATFSISQNLDRVDGMECIVLEAKGYQKLWLDPSLGFAVRQREFFHQKMLTKQEHCSDFVEVVPGVWLPRQVDRYIIGVPMMASLPNAFRGKKLVQTNYKVVRFEANKNSHDSLFVLTPKAGSFVSDERLPLLDTSGKPIKDGKGRKVSYIQPADPADLQRVIREAQQFSDVVRGRERGNPHRRSLLTGVAAGLFAVFIGLAIWRIWRARRDRTAR